MAKDLKGKRILITGASRGIGAGIARALAPLKTRLILHYHENRKAVEKVHKQVSKAGAKARMMACDFRQGEVCVARFYQKAEAAFDGIDILINNAGVVPKELLLESPMTLWQQTMAINLDAPYQLSNLFADARRRTGAPGVILHISSIHGGVTSERFGPYAASKAALDRLAQAQAIEGASLGIRVNVIAPGVTLVERNRRRLETSREAWHGHLPMARYGEVEDMALLARFLLSEQAAWITGQIYTVDGGLTARGHYPSRHQKER